jgi:hypothetical protein
VVPGAGPVTESLTCLYTMTADRRFIVGEVPGVPQVLVASACSGHGFKFGPAIGEALADLVCGIARPDLDFLSPARLFPGGTREGPAAQPWKTVWERRSYQAVRCSPELMTCSRINASARSASCAANASITASC